MSKVKGTVARVGDGKFSKFIMLEGRDGFYFNTKFNPSCGVGDTVGIEYEPKGDTRGNIKKVVILTDAGGPKGVQESSNSAPSGGGGKRSFTDQRPSIVWQHSQEMAIRLITTMLSNECVKLPKAADREAFVLGLVDDYTSKFNDEGLAAKLRSESDADVPATNSDAWDDEPQDEWAADDEWSD